MITPAGQTVQGIGEEAYLQKAYRPLDILAIQQSPDNYDTNIVTHQDKRSGLTWFLYTPNAAGSPLKHPALDTATRGLVWFSGLILLLAVPISIWHGNRYGQLLIVRRLVRTHGPGTIRPGTDRQGHAQDIPAQRYDSNPLQAAI
ncbi:hypothetical protein ABER23_06695 [Paenibacillus lautus]|uniref:hypothetical protein n=1 Tax=Paenibacillus lautus TaxID=1401 RepID=UPI003D2DE0D4